MSTLTPLLTTKLYLPPARPTLVPRPRLKARLAQGLTRPLTLISAPAGFGKTTLVSEWCASEAGRDFLLAWFSLDGDDNDPTRFLTYLIAALATLKPGLGETTLALLHSPRPPPPQAVLTGLINDLEAFDAPFALILDDYHVITAQPVHEALAFILDHLPPQMRLVILTRADPPLPLSRLRGRNQLTEIRAADLRFTREEAEMFLNRAMGLALSADDVQALESRTEGWIAGLQLAALSMEGREDPSHFIRTLVGSHRYIVDYLADEVLNHQSDLVRSFLLKTSIVHRLTGTLCDSLTELTHGQATLESLDQGSLFVVPLDDQRRWYRYHNLFADALRNRLHLLHPEWVPGLHRRAAEWFERQGLVSDAISHAVAGEDKARATRLVEENALSMVMRRELVTLANWLKTVEADRQERPWLCVYQAWMLYYAGQLDGIERHLQKSERLVAASLPTEQVQARGILGHIAAIRAGAAFVHKESARVIDHAEEALRHLPESEVELRTLVNYLLGGAYWLNGDLGACGRALENVDRTGRVAENVPLVVLALSALGRLHLLKGQPHRAAEICREAMRLASSQHGQLLPIAADACFGLGIVSYEWNDLTAATDHLGRFAELGELSGVASYVVLSKVLQARLRQAKGDSNSAFDLLHQAERLAKQSDLGIDVDTRIAAYGINIRLDGGDLEAAARLARERGMSLEGAADWRRVPEYSAFVRVLLAQGEHSAALTLLEQLLRSVESKELSGHAIELLALQALAFCLGGDRPKAFVALKRSLALAEPEGYVRVFLDEGAPMARLLRDAGSQGIAPKYLTRLLAEFDAMHGPGSIPPGHQPMAEALSERELEILRLVAAGKSNQQVADALILATGTVKKHLNNIFGKLGVQSRTQCVAKARELNLL